MVSYTSSITEVHDHIVQVYRDAPELATSVGIFLAAGFEAGEPAVVVASAAHLPLIGSALEAQGWDRAQLEAQGRLLVADAEQTLTALYEDGVLSKRRFGAAIGALVDRAAAAAPGRRVRIFGEMVDLLCRRDAAGEADVLEELWNQLAAERRFLLFCGYKVDLFDRAAQLELLPQIYSSHSHVHPVADAEQLDEAVRSAILDTLGPADAEKLYARVSQTGHDAHVPVAQRALMWLSAHMPRTAEQVLAVSRERYDEHRAAAA